MGYDEVSNIKTVTNDGSTLEGQYKFFNDYLSDNPHIKNILEIGFNTGVGADAILSSNPDIHLISVEMSVNKQAKNYIDKKYPGRHTLFEGNSVFILYNMIDHFKGYFDLIFIDGGHGLLPASSDIYNSIKLCKSTGVIIIDDITPHKIWGYGPYLAYHYYIQELKLMTTLGYYITVPPDNKNYMKVDNYNTIKSERCWVIIGSNKK